MISPKQNTLTGTGDGLCLLMKQTGIGDDVHAIPSLSQLDDATIFCRPFTRKALQRTGARTFEVRDNTAYNVNGYEDFPEEIPLDLSFYHLYKSRFGKIISLNSWSCWDTDEVGYSRTGMLEYFAELIGVTLPDEFSYREFFGLREREPKDYILYIPESTENWRTIPKDQARMLGVLLGRNFPNVIPLKHCETFEEMINVVDGAKAVVSVENGVLNLAAALGVPVVGLHGATSPDHTIDRLKRYGEFKEENVLGSPPPQCKYPCYRKHERGMQWVKTNAGREQRCCGLYHEPKCLVQLDREAVVEALINIGE
ncbi:MAG: hypothetical protein KGH93_03310 [Patescibacteria group bacterium]|nr:hypothetical protein [Patescibacteria group bacterium]